MFDTISTAARDELQARWDAGQTLTPDEYQDMADYDTAARYDSLHDTRED